MREKEDILLLREVRSVRLKYSTDIAGIFALYLHYTLVISKNSSEKTGNDLVNFRLDRTSSSGWPRGPTVRKGTFWPTGKGSFIHGLTGISDETVHLASDLPLFLLIEFGYSTRIFETRIQLEYSRRIFDSNNYEYSIRIFRFNIDAW